MAKVNLSPWPSLPSLPRLPSVAGRYTVLAAGAVLGGLVLYAVWMIFHRKPPLPNVDEMESIAKKFGFTPSTSGASFRYGLTQALNKVQPSSAYPQSLGENRFAVTQINFDTLTLIGDKGIYRLRWRDDKKESLSKLDFTSDPVFSVKKQLCPLKGSSSQEFLTVQSNSPDKTIVWTERASKQLYFYRPPEGGNYEVFGEVPLDSEISQLWSGTGRIYVATKDNNISVYSFKENCHPFLFSKRLGNEMVLIKEYHPYNTDEGRLYDILLVSKEGTVFKAMLQTGARSFRVWHKFYQHNEPVTFASVLKNPCASDKKSDDYFLFVTNDKEQSKLISISDGSEYMNFGDAKLKHPVLNAGCLLAATKGGVTVYDFATKKLIGKLGCHHPIQDLAASEAGVIALGPEGYTKWDFKP